MSSGRAGAGASSTTFWWRRCSEQSRSPSTSHARRRVADDLHLDVPAVLDVRLDEDRRRRRTPRAPRPRRPPTASARSASDADDPHAPSAAAGGRLDEQREVGLGRLLRHREDRYAGGRHEPLRLDLRAHLLHRLRCRPDPDEPGLDDGAGEGGVLGEEAVAGVDRVGPGPQGRVDQQVAAR